MNQVQKLSIGTAKFGMNYDYLNNSKMLKMKTCHQILDYATNNSIKTIDTAQAYGASEQVIGSYMKKNVENNLSITTKLTLNSNMDFDISASLERLNLKKVYGALFHVFDDFNKNKQLYEKLNNFKKDGLVEKIGFSLYFPEQLEQLINSKIHMDIIQVSYSPFDQRFVKYFKDLKMLGIEIHVRSVFLHGLYFKNPNHLSSYFDEIKNKLMILKKISVSSDISIASICVNFALKNEYVDKVIIGVDNELILLQNIKLIREFDRDSKVFDGFSDLAVHNVDMLFPHHWKH